MHSPEEILTNFYNCMQKIQGSDDLDRATRKKIHNDLIEAYNYLSGLHKRPSAERFIRSQSAHDAKQQEQLEKERHLLNEHKSFVENSIDKADQYLKTIQLGGYAAFFAVWGITSPSLNYTLKTTTAILMILSAIAFVGWEIWKATILTLALKRHASITSGLENFVQNRYHEVIQKNSLSIARIKQRAWVWLFCIGTAIPALLILLTALIVDLIVCEF